MFLLHHESMAEDWADSSDLNGFASIVSVTAKVILFKLSKLASVAELFQRKMLTRSLSLVSQMLSQLLSLVRQC